MATQQSFYATSNVPFKTNKAQIDYFKIPIDSLVEQGYYVKRHEIVLGPNEHLSVSNHLKVIDDSVKETVVLNIQVGKGKTTACYQLIQHYAKLGYKVLVLSPFKKLVEKDYAAVNAAGVSVFHYKQLDADDYLEYDSYREKDVQVMTINCLLGNPGDDRYAQSAIKSGYLNTLRDYCREKNQKVVMFFDEIHESIENFSADYIPNLIRWHQLVHKCFIASATYTPASVAVIKYIGLLTSGELNIIETPRIQVGNPAKLHLHLIGEKYSARNLLPLDILPKIINSNLDKRIHILTGYKTFANELTRTVSADTKGYNIINAVCSLKPTLVTAEHDNPFSETNNNIGTSFKTGIDIKDPNSLFIIVVPPISETGGYGIFSDGLPSIIQSFARIRNNASIHVFLPIPTTVILDDSGLSKIKLVEDATAAPHRRQSEFYDYMLSKYGSLKDERQKMIDTIMNLKAIAKVKLDYGYPSLEDFLIEKSENLLVQNEFSFGKELAPYILWAALNEQFTNAKLHQITFTRRRLKYVPLDKGNVVTTLGGILERETLLEATTMPLYAGALYLAERLEQFAGGALRFTIQGKANKPSSLWFSPYYSQGIVTLYLTTLKGNTTTLSKEDYILGNTLAAANASLGHSDKIYAYKRLYGLVTQFLSEINTRLIVDGSRTIIDKDIYALLPNKLFLQIAIVAKWLNTSDELLRTKVYQFLPNIEGLPIHDLKRSIYRELRACFTNISPSDRRSYNGQKDQFYLVKGSLTKTLPAALTNVKFL